MTIRGMVPVLVAEPHLRSSHSYLRTLAYDMDVVEGGGPLANQDAVITVGVFGLEYWTATPHVPIMTSVLLDDEGWLNARFVRCADVDADGDVDLIGIGSDKRTLLTKLRQLDGSWTDGMPYLLQEDVLRMEIAQWTPGAASPQLVLAFSSKLDVRETDGEFIESFSAPSSSTDQAVAILKRGLAQGDRVAWARPAASPGTQELFVVDSSGNEPVVSLGSDWVLEMSAADLDGDGDQDLCLNRADKVRAEFWVHADQEYGELPVQSFGSTAVETHDLDLPEGQVHPNRALPLLTDFDADGALDLYLPVDEFSGVSLLLGIQRLWLSEAMGEAMGFGTVTACYEDGLVQLDVHAFFPALFERNSSINAFEMVLWRADDYLGEVRSEADSRCTPSLGEVNYDELSGELSHRFVLNDAPEELIDWNALFFVEMRPIVLSGLEVDWAGQQLIGAFAMKLVAFEEVELYPPVQVDDVDVPSCSSRARGSGGRLGGFARGKRVPPSPPNDLPQTDVECGNEG